MKWCRYAYDIRVKIKNAIIFSDFVKLVKEEVELVIDLIFFFNNLKLERNKELNREGFRMSFEGRMSCLLLVNIFVILIGGDVN